MAVLVARDVNIICTLMTWRCTLWCASQIFGSRTIIPCLRAVNVWMFEFLDHARTTQAKTQYNPTTCEHVDLLRLATNRTSVFTDLTFKDLSTPSATRQSNRHSQYGVEGPQSGSKSRLSLTLTSSPSLNTCNAAGAACAEAASPSSQLEPTPTARRPPSGLNASADTPTGNFGYCFSRFLDVWSQTDTVPSEPPEANVLYLERLKK
jgi:hypothetical protein